jgi:hypothetical protein
MDLTPGQVDENPIVFHDKLVYSKQFTVNYFKK